MPTRKAFILAGAVSAVVTARGVAVSAAAPSAHPTPAPMPKPTSRPTKISPLAMALARSLQDELPKAHLSDQMRDAIAADIQDSFAIGKAFRKLAREQLPPPDFVFVASTRNRP